LVVAGHALSIRGRALDGEGRPVAGVVVRADLDGAAAATSRRAVADDDGQFVLGGLERGPYTLSLWHPDYAAAPRDGVPAGAAGVVAAGSDADGRFALEGLAPGGPVELAVVGPGGQYLKDAQHRTGAAEGETLDVGDVALFPGARAVLERAGSLATGIAFHSL